MNPHALPVFASGNGGYDLEQAFRIMLEELAKSATLPKIVFFTRHAENADVLARVLRERGLADR